MNIKQRLTAPTPTFWKKVRNIMLTAGSIGGALLMLPVALPAGVVTLATYALIVGATGSVLSQATKEDGTINLEGMPIGDLIKLQEAFYRKSNITESEKVLLNKVNDHIRKYQEKYTSN